MRRFILVTSIVTALTALTAAHAQEATALPPGAERIAEGFKFPEGPVVGLDGTFFFSDPMGSQILRFSGGRAEVFLDETKGANGLAMDKEGNIFACQSKPGAIVKISPDGAVETFVAQVDGRPLNRPNDLVFDDAGNLYFTNPGGRKDSPANVMRAGADGSAKIVAADQGFPNGIAFSPDGATLYVNDYITGDLWTYPIGEDGEVGEGSVLIRFDRGGPDGMAVAESGNVYIALGRANRVAVLSPDGEELPGIQFPERSGVSNVCFGGDDFKTLYVTLGANHSVYTVPVDEPGLKPYSHRP